MRTPLSSVWAAPANESLAWAPFALDANASRDTLNKGEHQAKSPEGHFLLQRLAIGDDTEVGLQAMK